MMCSVGLFFIVILLPATLCQRNYELDFNKGLWVISKKLAAGLRGQHYLNYWNNQYNPTNFNNFSHYGPPSNTNGVNLSHFGPPSNANGVSFGHFGPASNANVMNFTYFGPPSNAISQFGVFGQNTVPFGNTFPLNFSNFG